MRRLAKGLLVATLLGAGALPVLAVAQDRPASILPPGFEANEQQPANNSAASTSPPPATTTTSAAPAASEADEGDQLLVSSDSDVEELNLPPPPPPVEIPEFARRAPRIAGIADPHSFGLGAQPWGAASGAFLSTLMRRLDTPLPSRWLHIGLRNALIARVPAPRNVNPVDWAAERAWLLLRLGEADAARLLVSSVDTDNFTPKMTQVAVQAALANGDAAALCPLQPHLKGVEDNVQPVVQAICAALSGSADTASSQIDALRRRGRVGGIDLQLAGKVVGAGTNTAKAISIDWDPVSDLSNWRFGMATATGLLPPERLMNAAPARMMAWQARAPMLSAEQRLPAARVATGLGVFSSNALVDTYSSIYDATDPSDLGDTDAWQVRMAFAGRDEKTRLGAMRKLWGQRDKEPLQLAASWSLLARAAAAIRPDPGLQDDAVNLIASMLAGGLDQQAGRWASAVRQMDGEKGDRAWALLALGTEGSGVDVSAGRANDFIGRDDSRYHQRSALLVAGLAGLGRIDVGEANRLSSRNDLGLGETGSWSRLIDGAARRGQTATVLLLAASGMQTNSFARVPAANLLHAVTALSAVGLDFEARMLAAEALARS
ncbi:hypothetical protein [Sphingomonas ginkgonis]|uniref:hypothetical protein n=1 Tax=Sphingomonas ginkgonis TaxID=2315330 RepID=UPI001EF0639C|nr:hypothetical protein [Sphingomonas ginkgonis]